VSARDDVLFGPLSGPGRWRTAVRALNHLFGLRDCPDRVPMAFADQSEMFPGERSPVCLRHELGTCLAPCAGRCTQGSYVERVRSAREFLAGRDRSALERLQADMRAAAAERQFERAAVLRDQHGALEELSQQLQRVDEAQRHCSFVYPLPVFGRGERWYLIRGGEVVGAVRSPIDPRRAERCLETLDQVYRTAGPPLDYQDDLDSLLVVTAWFRAQPAELQRTIAPADARRRCREVLGGVEKRG
jgi:excinuclease ABC subunit C